MILTYLNSIQHRGFVVALGLLSVLLPSVGFAQGAVTLSVSPTLFEMTAGPTQVWSSNVRVINANPFPITIYADAVNFEPAGENGQGTMIPILADQPADTTLAQWIDIDGDEIVIPAEQTFSIPFTIEVPTDAAPGGHFAAILIGTRPFNNNEGAARVETSQVVTSLVFLRVAGDIEEKGQIRDFTTARSLSEGPEATFSLRFENQGNVHLQPQGDITITNMWGKERGVIPINRNSQFGNVLPESVRHYTFTWSGDWSFADIGRYTAITTLAYGEETRQFASAKTSFWVIPWRAVLSVLVIVGGLLWLIVWGIKLYIRRMLQLAGVTPELQHDTRSRATRRSVSITAPIEAGILDLRSELRSGQGSFVHSLRGIGSKYRVALLLAGALLVFAGLFVWYLVLALSSERGYEASFESDGRQVPLVNTSDSQAAETTTPIVVNTLPEIALVNRSGQSDVLSDVTSTLESRGYDVISDAGLTIGGSEDRTVIVYDPTYADDILQLQALFESALISAFIPEDQAEPKITIYLGSDLVQ